MIDDFRATFKKARTFPVELFLSSHASASHEPKYPPADPSAKPSASCNARSMRANPSARRPAADSAPPSIISALMRSCRARPRSSGSGAHEFCASLGGRPARVRYPRHISLLYTSACGSLRKQEFTLDFRVRKIVARGVEQIQKTRSTRTPGLRQLLRVGSVHTAQFNLSQGLIAELI